jgi:hypothetical protein
MRVPVKPLSVLAFFIGCRFQHVGQKAQNNRLSVPTMFVEDHIKHSLSWLAATGFMKPPIYENDSL